MQASAGPARSGSKRLRVLASIGVLLFCASLSFRLLDRPSEAAPIDSDDEKYYSQFFGVGLDTGTFKDLGCPFACPTNLVLDYDVTDPGVLYGKFLVTLEGVQEGDDPVRFVLVTPQGTENIEPVEQSDPGVTISTSSINLRPNGMSDNHGEPVNVSILTVPAIDGSVYFGVDFLWRPGAALVNDGFGRRKIRVPYTGNHPVLSDLGAYSLDIARPEDSLRDVALEVRAADTRIGDVVPESDGRPGPQTVMWRVDPNASELYYYVAVENASVRFWANLVNEQVLFFAGLLLGAVIGAVSSSWITARRSP